MRNYSFDVWNTLVKSNSEFATARAKYLANITGMAETDVRSVYTQTKTKIDELAEQHGIGCSTTAVVSSLLHNLRIKHGQSSNQSSPFHHLTVRGVVAGISELFEKHPPVIYDGARHAIEFLLNRDCVVTIGSNSNFISGETMHPYLSKELGLHEAAGVYSDLIEVSKPHPEFFKVVSDLHLTTPDRICHVGDNVICDGGAAKHGFDTIIVTNPNQLDVLIEAHYNSQNN